VMDLKDCESASGDEKIEAVETKLDVEGDRASELAVQDDTAVDSNEETQWELKRRRRR